MRSYILWTPEEEAQLIKLYTTTDLTYHQIGKNLGRSYRGIKNRIGKLVKNGTLERRTPQKDKKVRISWTPEDEEKLLNLYNTTTLTYEQIGRELRRNSKSIEWKIGRLIKKGKLKHRTPQKSENNRISWTPEEEEKLMKLYSTTTLTHEQISRELGKNFTSVKCRIRKFLEKGKLQGRWSLWAPEEDEKLVNLYSNTDLTYQQIGERLGRSLGSVNVKIGKLLKGGTIHYRTPKKIRNKYSYSLSDVEKCTPSGVWFIIAVVCDGNLQKRTVQFGFRKRDCVEFRDIICHILKISPPLNINWAKKERKRTQDYGSYGSFQINSKELAELLAEKYKIPIGKKSGIVRIPPQIMDTDDPVVHGAVLRSSYESEGSVDLENSSPNMLICNTSKGFVQDLSELCNRNRINHSIYEKMSKGLDFCLFINDLESILKFYEIAYYVFDLNRHITAKKIGLEALIKSKSNMGCKFTIYFNEIEFKQVLKGVLKRKFVFNYSYKEIKKWLFDNYNVRIGNNTLAQWLREDKIRRVFNKSREDIVRGLLM